MSSKKVVRSTSEQINYMLKYMAENPTFANHKNTNPALWESVEKEWESLRTVLKTYGPDKSTHQWKQTWRDLKRKYKINSNEPTAKENGDTSMADEFTENKTSDTLDSCEIESPKGSMGSPIGQKLDYLKEVKEDKQLDKYDYIKEMREESKKRTVYIKCTNTQISILLEYMATHRAFANGKLEGPTGIAKMEQQWQFLWETLKEYGPEKSIIQWKQTWRDLKKKARKEHDDKTSAMKKGRNGPTITDLSLKILEIIGYPNLQVNGRPTLELESDSYSESEVIMDRTLPESSRTEGTCETGNDQYFTKTADGLKQRNHRYYDILNFAITQNDKSTPTKVKKMKLEVDDYDTDDSSNNVSTKDPLYEDNSLAEVETHLEVTETCPQVMTAHGDRELDPVVKYVRVPDEFEALGISIAAKVRRMEAEQKIHAELLIQKVLAKGLLGQLNENIELVDLTSARLHNHAAGDGSNAAF